MPKVIFLGFSTQPHTVLSSHRIQSEVARETWDADWTRHRSRDRAQETDMSMLVKEARLKDHSATSNLLKSVFCNT